MNFSVAQPLNKMQDKFFTVSQKIFIYCPQVHKLTGFYFIQDVEVAKDFGVVEFPSLIYFENQVPNVFEGNLMEEEEVLQWLITQKTEDRIELITRVMLETMVEETQYLAVYFCKSKLKFA